MNSFGDKVNYFLLDLEKNGFGWKDLPFPKEDLQALCWDFPVILSLNWDVASLGKVLEEIQPTGINVRGGAEEKVGYKSFDELDPIFESIESEY